MFDTGTGFDRWHYKIPFHQGWKEARCYQMNPTSTPHNVSWAAETTSTVLSLFAYCTINFESSHSSQLS